MATESPRTASPAPDADPRLAIVFDEALRAITQQQGVLSDVRARAATAVSVAAVVTAFMGTTAVERHGIRAWTVVAIAAFVACLATSLAGLWPRRGWRFRSDVSKLLAVYIDGDARYTLNGMRRYLALQFEKDYVRNAQKLHALNALFMVTCCCLGVEVVAWLVELSGG